MDVMNYLNESTSDSNGVEPNSNKLPSSRYKGVVPQPNGRWGAQIYEKHQRVWLGTFNEEEEAAKAYDIASLRFRGLDAITNFKQQQQQPLKTTNIDDHDDDNNETLFLQSHSKAEIVDMLRKHSYTDELELYKHSNAARYEARKRIKCDNLSSTYKAKREWLFEKVATPSDVGRLNRMVIPKQQAEKHFPLMGNSEDDDHSAASSKGILLNFVDQVGKVWRFRYCYWSSSQSYVLTKGWSRFVKEKKLKAGDVVRFQRSIGENGKLFIDCTPRNVDVSRFADVPGSRVDDDDPLVPGQVDGVVRLFGVNIVETCSSCVVDNRRCWRLGAKMR